MVNLALPQTMIGKDTEKHTLRQFWMHQRMCLGLLGPMCGLGGRKAVHGGDVWTWEVCNSSRVCRSLMVYVHSWQPAGSKGERCNCDLLFCVVLGCLGAGIDTQVIWAVEAREISCFPPKFCQTCPFYLSCPFSSCCHSWVPESHQRQQRAVRRSTGGCPDVAASARSWSERERHKAWSINFLSLDLIIK